MSLPARPEQEHPAPAHLSQVPGQVCSSSLAWAEAPAPAQKTRRLSRQLLASVTTAVRPASQVRGTAAKLVPQ